MNDEATRTRRALLTGGAASLAAAGFAGAASAQGVAAQGLLNARPPSSPAPRAPSDAPRPVLRPKRGRM